VARPRYRSRDPIPSFVKTFPRRHSTARGLKKSRAPMSGFETPSRASRATRRTRLALDLRAPGVDVLVVLQVVDQLVVHKQLAVVVAAIDTRNEVVDASPDVNGIVDDLPRHDDARRASRHPHFPCEER
jgi:hypothetical protein